MTGFNGDAAGLGPGLCASLAGETFSGEAGLSPTGAVQVAEVGVWPPALAGERFSDAAMPPTGVVDRLAMAEAMAAPRPRLTFGGGGVLPFVSAIDGALAAGPATAGRSQMPDAWP